MTSEILTPSAKLSPNNNTNIITSAVAHSQVSPNFIKYRCCSKFYVYFYLIYFIIQYIGCYTFTFCPDYFLMCLYKSCYFTVLSKNI